MRLERRQARRWLAGWLVVFAAVTLSPRPGEPEPANFRPGFDTVVGALDVAGNVLMFVPLGLLAPAATGQAGRRRVLAAAAALSGVVEAVQLLEPLGRTTDVNDLIANVLGCAVGLRLAARP